MKTKTYTKEEIIEKYRANESIRATAQETGLCTQSVRRIVIESGDFVSPLSLEIKHRIDEGESIEEIAAALNLKPKTVLGYLPYTKGSYRTGEKSKNASNIARWREKKAEEKHHDKQI